MTIPDSMKAAVLYSFSDIRIEDVPVPAIGPGEALVRVRASGICSGDVMPWYIEKKAPLVLGHEPAGEIVAVGEGVHGFATGNRVFVHHHAPCMKCSYCRKGDHVQCETWRNSRIDPGGIAEYMRVPAVNLMHDTLHLPASVSFNEAVFVEPLACVVKGLRRIRIRPGDTALVIGMGVMGQLHIPALASMGVTRIIAADKVPFRLRKALELGADDVIDVSRINIFDRLSEITTGKMADLVIVGPASAAAMETGLSCVAPGGTVLFFSPAVPGEKLAIDPNALYFRDISVVTSYSCGPEDTRRSLELIRSKAVPVESLITHVFPIERTAEAYRLTASGGDSLKTVITFG